MDRQEIMGDERGELDQERTSSRDLNSGRRSAAAPYVRALAHVAMAQNLLTLITQ